MPTVLC